MLTTVNPQPSLWEAILPEICLRMPAELEREKCPLTVRPRTRKDGSIRRIEPKRT
jgi:hypothetical protein